jgi:hypothetical protein
VTRIEQPIRHRPAHAADTHKSQNLIHVSSSGWWLVDGGWWMVVGGQNQEQ